MVVTYFGFGNTDLGATTKEIKYTDEAGVAQSKTITKEEFRIGIPIYGFENTKNNDSISWWRYGIGRLIVTDLEQNKSLSPFFQYNTKTSTKIKEASTFNNFYPLSGIFRIKKTLKHIHTFRTAYIYNTLHKSLFIKKL